ncbi:unnamed protein product, partial [Cuscuta europaea]
MKKQNYSQLLIYSCSRVRLQDSVPELHPVRYQDIPIHSISEEVRNFILKASKTRSSMTVIWNTMEDLEQTWLSRFQQHCKVPIFQIGPLHKIASTGRTSLIDEDDSCLVWLDKEAPQSVLFVSASGSLGAISERDF